MHARRGRERKSVQSNAICAISIAFSSEYISILIFNIGWPRYSFTWGYRARASLNRRVCVFFFNATEADWPVRLRTMHQDLKIQKSTKHCNDQNLKMAKSKCRFKRGATTSHFKEDEAASEEPPQKRRVSFRRLTKRPGFEVKWLFKLGRKQGRPLAGAGCPK